MRLLVIDDDPLSRTWLLSILGDAGTQVTAVATLEAGRAALAAEAWHAVLCDLRLPDGDGRELARRRAGLGAGGLHAMSADMDAATRAELAAIGFDHAWQKPIDAPALLHALGIPPGHRADASVREPGPTLARPLHAIDDTVPDLDDEAGLRACGDPGVLADLRTLLRAELPAACRQVEAAWSRGDRAATAEALHRLLAGARYCGALRLLAAIDRFELQARAPGDPSTDAAALAAFRLGCDRLLTGPD